MRSLILSTAIRYLHPLMLLFSVFLLLRGHNNPGGGFIGGLTAAAAFSHYSLAFGVAAARAKLGLDPRLLSGFGLLVALVSGVFPMLAGGVFLSGKWLILGPVHIGTPVLFDVGVYLVVIGISLTIIFSLGEE